MEAIQLQRSHDIAVSASLYVIFSVLYAPHETILLLCSKGSIPMIKERQMIEVLSADRSLSLTIRMLTVKSVVLCGRRYFATISAR